MDEFSAYQGSPYSEEFHPFTSSPGRKIVIINNSGDDNLGMKIEHREKVDVWQLPFELTHCQEYNWMIKACLEENELMCLSTHTDTELLPGAVETAAKACERVLGTKWYAYGIGGAQFVAYNPRFFQEENVWFDPFLFPFYFMDNHMGRIAKLRGWSDFLVMGEPVTSPMTGFQETPQLIKHVSSHYLKENPIFCKKNNIAFKYHQQIYAEIWGGVVGSEKSTDPWASGTLPKVVK
jgi:hypothetical protein